MPALLFKICDINFEQPNWALLWNKITDLYFSQRKWMGCSELTSQIWTKAREMAATIALRGIWFSYWKDRKWRKVIGITQYFPNENPKFQSKFYMLRMKFDIDFTYIRYGKNSFLCKNCKKKYIKKIKNCKVLLTSFLFRTYMEYSNFSSIVLFQIMKKEKKSCFYIQIHSRVMITGQGLFFFANLFYCSWIWVVVYKINRVCDFNACIPVIPTKYVVHGFGRLPHFKIEIACFVCKWQNWVKCERSNCDMLVFH